MTTMTLNVPDELEREHDETVRFMAAKLVEAGKLTLGQGAEMCGMKKRDFLEILGDYDVHYFEASFLADIEAYNKAKSEAK